jgi:chromate reductase
MAESIVPPVRILAVAGSLRKDSINRKLLALAVREAQRASADVDVVDLKTLALPIYDGDLEAEAFPTAAMELKERLARARGFLIATPEFNHSIPGGLKNAIDWASRPPTTPNPFRDKPALIMGATPGPGGTLYAQNHLREVLTALGVWLLPSSFSLPGAGAAFDEEGEIKDERRRAHLAKVVPQLVHAAQAGVPKLS